MFVGEFNWGVDGIHGGDLSRAPLGLSVDSMGVSLGFRMKGKWGKNHNYLGRKLTNGVDIPPVLLRLRVDQRIPINLRSGSQQNSSGRENHKIVISFNWGKKDNF